MLEIIKKRNIFFTISSIAVLLSIGALVMFGLKPGIDFTGGSLIEVEFTTERPELSEMQSTMDSLEMGNVTVQPTDDKGYFVKLRFVTEDEHQQILSTLRESYQTEENKVLENRVETIGSSISSQLRKRAWSAGIAVIIAIVLYVAYAFRRVSRPVQSWKYGITAIIALVHDVLIVMGIFAVLGHFYGVEIDIPFVVALLTILGYSVNDTIVVFDRVREELIRHGNKEFEVVVNRGVNGTLIRSLNTSLTTLLVLMGLFLFGGLSIHYFSLALIIGIISGTYSSIFLASPFLIVWQKLGKR